MRKNFIVWFCMICAGSLFAQQRISEQIGNVVAINESGQGIAIKCKNAQVLIRPYTDQIVRVRVVKNEFGPDFSYAVNIAPKATFTQISDNDKMATFSTAKVRVVVNKKPFYLSFYNQKGELVNADDSLLRISWMGSEVTNYKKLFTDEKFIGLGEKTGGLNRRGNVYHNWNSDVPGYGLEQDPLYATIPFYIGIHSKLVYGIFLDNSFRSQFDFGGSTDEQAMSFGAVDGELDYYYIAGNNVGEIIYNYTHLTGRAQLPPLWSLGYQQCRYSYFPDKDLLNIARTFREKEIPADVIYLDIHYMDDYKVFTFHPQDYPNPAATIAELKQMGFKAVVIVDPGLKVEKGYPAYDEGVKNNYFIKYPDGRIYTGKVWPGRSHFPDFTNPKSREWWGSLFDVYTKIGIAGIWNDMNEPSVWGQNIPNLVECDYDGYRATMAQVHNIYGMQMARATYEGMRKLLPNTRFLNITRATYAGGQRYSTIWTGDNAAYDEHMLLGVRLVNSLGVSGFPFPGPDIGGFEGNPSANLMIRWMNIGIFTPFFRNHVGYFGHYREPWMFGKEPEKILRRIIGLRYQLLPYLYSCAYEASLTGMPINRTLAIDYTFDENIYRPDFENEYLFGPFMLITPVASAQNFAKVYLPEGKWYRLSTDEPYEAGTHLVEAPIDDMPVFVKSGAIIPMQSVIQNTEQSNDGILYLHVYAGTGESSFLFYEDDGISYNYTNGEYHKRLIQYNPVKKTITLPAAEGFFTSRYRQIKFILHGMGKIQRFNNLKGQSVNFTVKDKNIYEIIMPYEKDAMELSWK